ncbi:MAG: hypothetical protein WA055_03970 [Candidatus Moraniibacteriota bacterium]
MEITSSGVQSTGITMEQAQAISGVFGNNVDWGYLHSNFNLQKILEIIKRNEECVGQLFTDILINFNFKPDNIRKKKKLFFTEFGIRISFEIKWLLIKNIKWSSMDFKTNELQKKIIGNSVGFGQSCTDFLISLITNSELELA